MRDLGIFGKKMKNKRVLERPLFSHFENILLFFILILAFLHNRLYNLYHRTHNRLYNEIEVGILMVTMQDIATRAGVNKGTVSYILNGKHKQARIGDKICLQVKDIAKELGYQRNELARSVATGKSNVLAFVSCVDSSDEYTSRIMAGIVEELTEQKFALKVYHLSSDNSLDIAKQIISQRVVGVIFHAPLNSDFKIVQQTMKKNHIPCATTNLTSKHVDLGVTTDDTQGVEDSVKHLAELGHQRILYFSYQEDEHSEYVQHREAGYIAGMKR